MRAGIYSWHGTDLLSFTLQSGGPAAASSRRDASPLPPPLIIVPAPTYCHLFTCPSLPAGCEQSGGRRCPPCLAQDLSMCLHGLVGAEPTSPHPPGGRLPFSGQFPHAPPASYKHVRPGTGASSGHEGGGALGQLRDAWEGWRVHTSRTDPQPMWKGVGRQILYFPCPLLA